MATPVWQARGKEMPDTYTLGLKNFRSIEDTMVEIAPLTVVYGPNGSGKSSLIYGLLTLRNFLTNPNQNVPSLFSYPSISLGGRNEVVHRHSADKGIALSIGVSSRQDLSSTFTLTLDESGGTARISFDKPSHRDGMVISSWPNALSLDISIPYLVNQQANQKFDLVTIIPIQVGDNRSLTEVRISGDVVWNGLVVAPLPNSQFFSDLNLMEGVSDRANLPMEMVRKTGLVPLRRGFSKPLHNLVSITPELTNEDEVASLLASPTERFVQYEISRYVEKIAERRIQTQGQIGTSMFWIDSIPVGKGVPASIVNEGFGINQLVYLLTVCLYSRYKIVAIEEPEIHLHPSMVRELAIALAEIAVEKDRRLIVSTHSETFVVALLSQIAAGKISVDDVSFVHAENPDGSTILTQQKANRNGQIEGGLRAFMASEAKDLVDFLGLSGE